MNSPSPPGFEKQTIKAVEKRGVRADLNDITMYVYDEPLGDDGLSPSSKVNAEKVIRNARVLKSYNRHLQGESSLCLMHLSTTIARARSSTSWMVPSTLAPERIEGFLKTTKLHGMRDTEYLDRMGVLLNRMTTAHAIRGINGQLKRDDNDHTRPSGSLDVEKTSSQLTSTGEAWLKIRDLNAFV